jgi:OmpA-OmpF porin, OOP family
MLLALPLLFGVRQHETALTMEAEINNTGAALVYGVTFQKDTASLEPGSEGVLQQIVVLMKAHTDWRFEVQGHTAGIGSRVTKLAESAERAKAVVAWLGSHGVEADRLRAKGYGDTRPVIAGTSDEARALNVRIQLRKLNEE